MLAIIYEFKLKPSEGNKRREDIKDNDVEELDNKVKIKQCKETQAL